MLFAVAVCVPVLAAGQGAPPRAAGLPDPTLEVRPAPKAPPPPSSITPAGSIHLDVLVSDAAGKRVTDLLPLDFTILDNGQPRKVLSFRAYDGASVKPNPPVEVVLLVDTVNLPFAQISFVHQELARFLRQNGGKLAQPVTLMLLSGDGLHVQPRPSTDGMGLVAVLDQIKGTVHSIYSAMGSDGDLQRFQLSLRQVEAIAKPGDVLVGISTSGNSHNVICALEAARAHGVMTVAFTGEGGGRMGALADHLFAVSSRDTARIQEAHILAGHMLCDWLELDWVAAQAAAESKEAGVL